MKFFPHMRNDKWGGILRTHLCFAMAEHNVETFREFDSLQTRKYCMVSLGSGQREAVERFTVGHRNVEVHQASIEHNQDRSAFAISDITSGLESDCIREIDSLIHRVNSVAVHFANPEVVTKRVVQPGSRFWKPTQSFYAKYPAFYFEYPFEPPPADYISDSDPMRKFRDKDVEDTGFLFLERPEPQDAQSAVDMGMATRFHAPTMCMSPLLTQRQRQIVDKAFRSGPWKEDKNALVLSIGCTAQHTPSNFLMAKELVEQAARFIPNWHDYAGKRKVLLDIEIKESDHVPYSGAQALHTGTAIFLLMTVPYRENRKEMIEVMTESLKETLRSLKQCVSGEFKWRNKIEIDPLLRHIDDLVRKSDV